MLIIIIIIIIYNAIFLSVCLVPSEPLNLDYTNATSTSINLTWESPLSPNGDIESYTLQITDISTDSIPTLNIANVSGITGNNTVLTGVLPYHSYELVLYALTDRGAGPGSTPLIVYTLQDSKYTTQLLKHLMHYFIVNKL